MTIKAKWKRGFPRYGYLETPKGRWREDRKTGEFLWRKLGNPFPDGNSNKKKKSKRSR